MYGAETWALTKQEKLAVAQQSMERLLLNITKRDKTRNEIIRSKTGVKDIIFLEVNNKYNKYNISRSVLHSFRVTCINNVFYTEQLTSGIVDMRYAMSCCVLFESIPYSSAGGC